MNDSTATPPDVEAFWHWWSSEGATRCADAIARGGAEDLVEELTERIGAVQEGLVWELGPGVGSEHVLVVSPEGDPALRAVARRWLRAAPEPTATWEYADSRQPVDLADVSLSLGEHTLPLDQIRVATTREGNRLGVVLHHEAFEGLSHQALQQVAVLALDAALGEDDVETWISSINVTAEAPGAPETTEATEEAEAAPAPGAPGTAEGDAATVLPLGDLAASVQQLREEHLDDQGHPTWVLLRGTGPGGAVLVGAQVPLSPTSAPELDDHLGVRVPYAGRTEDGFPDEASLAALRVLEDDLTERIGSAGRLVAHETSDGARVLHYYVDSTSAVDDVARAAVTDWSAGEVQVDRDHDPAWAAVAPFRT